MLNAAAELEAQELLEISLTAHNVLKQAMKAEKEVPLKNQRVARELAEGESKEVCQLGAWLDSQAMVAGALCAPLHVFYTVTESHILVRFMKSAQSASFRLLMSLNSEFCLWLMSGPNKIDSEFYYYFPSFPRLPTRYPCRYRAYLFLGCE